MFNNFYPNVPYMGQNRPFDNNFMQRQEVLRVNGKNGAEALKLPPNSSALALDENEPIVWLIVTDSAGYPSLTAYTITPYKEKPPIDLGNLEERIAKLEGLFNESNTNNSKQKRTDKAE